MVKAKDNGFSPLQTGNDPRKDSKSRSGDGGSSQWLKLNDGDFTVVTVLAESEEIISCEQCAIWLDEGNSPVWVYTGPDDPSNDLAIKRTYRAFLPVLTEDGETKVFSMSKTVHMQVVELAETIGTLKGSVLRIKRVGKMLQTKYNITNTGKRKSLKGVEEVDVVSMLGPLTPEGVRDLIAEKLGKEDYEAVLASYTGKRQAKTNGAQHKGKTTTQPAFEEPEDEEELELV